jgi:hypothetical protein
MPIVSLSVEVKSRWWLPVYIKTLKLFCMMLRCEPNYEKVTAFIVKHGISQSILACPVKK